MRERHKHHNLLHTQDSPPPPVPHLTPPSEPVFIHLATFEVALIASEPTISHHLNRLASLIDPFRYDTIVYNLEGGNFLRSQLYLRWSRHFHTLPTAYPINYRSIASPTLRKPSVTPGLSLDDLNLQGNRVLLIEDLDDTGDTIHTIADAARAQHILLDTAILVNKLAPKLYLNPTIRFTGFTIPDLWIAGCGADFSIPELDREFDRNSPMLVMPIAAAAQFYNLPPQSTNQF